jgi:mono/diheme cytochrome c family protein
MSYRFVFWVAAFALICWVGVSAQNAPAATPQASTPEIKHVPATYTSPSSGKEMYNAYCASCHGADGKGDGPAAPALKAPPTNLTTLAAKNGGAFPAAHVAPRAAVLNNYAARHYKINGFDAGLRANTTLKPGFPQLVKRRPS